MNEESIKLLKRKGPRHDNDNYKTPNSIAKWTVQKCVDIIGGSKNGNFLEPGCGDDAPFAHEAASLGMNSYGFDIRHINNNSELVSLHNCYDFMSGDIPPTIPYKFDIIATNPPFVHAIGFWTRSLDLLSDMGVMAMVVKLNMLGSKHRAVLLNSRPPVEVHIIYPRPSFTGNSSTDIAQEYCVVFWCGRRLSNIINKPTSLYWLNWKTIATAEDFNSPVK